MAERDWDAAKKFISDEVVFAHSIAGTANDCRSQLHAFVNAGLNLPVLLPMGTQEMRKEVARMATQLVA